MKTPNKKPGRGIPGMNADAKSGWARAGIGGAGGHPGLQGRGGKDPDVVN